MVVPDGALDVEELDEYLVHVNVDALIGRKVLWHNGEELTAVRLTNGALGLVIDLRCAEAECRATARYYLISGLHSGAWCYVADEKGNYLGNLRDEEWRCPEHESVIR